MVIHTQVGFARHQRNKNKNNRKVRARQWGSTTSLWHNSPMTRIGLKLHGGSTDELGGRSSHWRVRTSSTAAAARASASSRSAEKAKNKKKIKEKKLSRYPWKKYTTRRGAVGESSPVRPSSIFFSFPGLISMKNLPNSFLSSPCSSWRIHPAAFKQ